MKRVGRVGIMAVVVGMATFFAIWWFSAEQVLKRRVGDLIDAAEVSKLTSDLARQTRGQKIAGYFGKEVAVVPPGDVSGDIAGRLDDGTMTRDRLVMLYSMAARGSREISFVDLEVRDVSVDGDRAEVPFRVDCVVDLDSRRPVDGLLDVQSQWVKSDDAWQIVELSWTEAGR